MTPEPKIVVAGNYREFDYWCRYVNDPPINPYDGRAAVYVSSVITILGRRFSKDQIVQYGTYFERRDWPGIGREIEARVIDP